MDLQKYITLVEDTRKAQSEYFSLTKEARKNKSLYTGVRLALEKAKQLEAQLDEATAQIKKTFS